MDLVNTFFGFGEVGAHHPPFYMPVHQAQIVFAYYLTRYMVARKETTVGVHFGQKGFIIINKCNYHGLVNRDKFINKMTDCLYFCAFLKAVW
jgi:hypothetical protein